MYLSAASQIGNFWRRYKHHLLTHASFLFMFRTYRLHGEAIRAVINQNVFQKNTQHMADTMWCAQLVDEQSPSAVVLACSDSRCPPELVFDQGLGDLFVVR